MGPAGAMKLLGLEYAVPNSRLRDVLAAVGKIPDLNVSAAPLPPDPSGPMSGWAAIVRDWQKSFAATGPSVGNALTKMRVKKSPEELALMRRAASVSAQGHIEAMRSAKPGMREYEIQALVEYVFARGGCESVAYNSIVGSGPNSTILHYEEDRRLMQSGDIVCMDVAGEYHGYAADVTRSYPVNGKFSPPQRAIYEVVLEAQNAGIRECRAGNPFNAAHRAAAKVLGDGLLRLGIIKDRNDLGQYFMHGTSHYVGLDVHDAHGDNTLRESYVLTVEPGLYIKAGSPCDKKWWNIGVRIEDDILVTKDGPVILSSAAPRNPDDIEALMRQTGIGQIPLRGR
jgi:Xaa-Pro aminopeptidase